MLHAVIMAGGAGTRFWPESRVDQPKQLLRLAGPRSMLQATVDRLGTLAPPERVLIVTAARLVEQIAAQLPEVPAESLLGEPCKRDTAPCIGLAAQRIVRVDPQGTMAVMPADHVIQPDEAFQAAIRYAADLVEEQPGRIVTFGIQPTYPAETFGYIQRGAPLRSPATPAAATSSAATTLSAADTSPVATSPAAGTGQPGSPPTYQVAQFREKPTADVAREYLASGDFYWNSGIFVWKAQTILTALAEHQPALAEHLERIAAAFGKDEFQQVFEREFSAIKGISIDYAVMEHARDVLVVEAPFQWDDLGSWRALARLHGTDAEGNTIVGRHVGIETNGTIVRTTGEHLVATLGVQDLIVVHTPRVTLVADKHQEESIRDLVRRLTEEGATDVL